MEIRRALEQGEYNDPVQVRRLLKSSRFAKQEFKDALWEAILEAYPCPMESDMPGNLTSAKKKVWEQMVLDAPELSAHEHIVRKCRNSNLCMQCACKKKIIDFFVSIESGSADTIRHRLTSWLSGKVHKLDRLTCIQLCFAMNMRVYPLSQVPSDEEKKRDARRFLTLRCKQPPLYTIRTDEAVYYYCLANPEGRSNTENWKYACDLIDKAKHASYEESDDDMYTMFAVTAMEDIRSEGELLRFLSNIRLSEHEQYATAKENCRLLFEQFDLSEAVARSVDEKFGNRDRSGKSRMLLKKDAIRILDALVRFDDTGELDAEVLNDLEKYDFGDILYSSDRLEELLNDDVLPDRTVLLFTVLAQNCGMKYDPETNTLEESDDLTDIPSFNEYYSNLTIILQNMGMAPLYPRWRTDFIVLYAYHLMQKDLLDEKEPNSISGYIIKALKLTMEEDQHA